MTNEKRKFDITVFGATGVTGQYVVEELALHTKGLNWCVAGRNVVKLTSLLKEVSKNTNTNLKGIETLVVTASDDPSLAAMCKSTRLVLNCVGPYRFTGERIVEECVKSGTHHVDVSGEPQFLELVQLKFFEMAKEQNVYIVGSCGFDSIPCDLGVEVLRKQFKGDLNSVETYISVTRPPGSTVNFGTWQSAIYGLANAHELKPLRKDLKEKVFTVGLPKQEYPIVKRSVLFKSEEVKGWCIPFIGSDRSVVLRTQMYNYQYKKERPLQIQTYMKTYSCFYALVTLLMGGIFMLMTKFAVGRYLLEKFPEVFSLGVFSRTPPPREKGKDGCFEIVFKGEGWSEKLLDPADKHKSPPNKTIKAVLEGPDPGYITTAICVVNSAVVILSETDKLPSSGGVFTPGAAFSETSLMKKLSDRGIKLNIVES